MKFNLFFCCFLFASFQIVAQQEMGTEQKQTGPEEQTLFNNNMLRGAWGGLHFSHSRVSDYSGFGLGGSVGLVFNSLSLGLYGHGEVFDGFKRDNRDYAFTLGHGGLFLGYSYPTKKALHLMSSVKLGGGGVGLARRYSDWDWEFEEDDFNDAVFVVIPEVGVELNLTHWMRLSATAGYRFVGGFQGITELGKKDLNAPMFGLNFRFGWFGHGK
jgi:hypothetical protein